MEETAPFGVPLAGSRQLQVSSVHFVGGRGYDDDWGKADDANMAGLAIQVARVGSKADVGVSLPGIANLILYQTTLTRLGIALSKHATTRSEA